MRISALFRKKTPVAVSPKTMDDPIFGKVERDKKLWMASKYFGLVGREIDIGIASGADGPTQAQRDIYQRIEQQYDDLLGQYRSFFLSQYGPLPDGTTVEELFDSLQLQFIYISDIADSPVGWEMTFTTELEDHAMTPRFTDM